MEPIAIYQVKRLLEDRRYELFEDSIRIVGSANYVDYDGRIPIARLDTQFLRVRTYSALFHIGYWVVVVAAMALMAFSTYVEMYDNQISLVRPIGWIGGFGGIGLVLALWNYRKIESVVFRSDAGNIVLSFSRNGKKKEDFDRFLTVFVEQIHKARGLPEQPIASGDL
jgi:hypothetical protein